MLRTLAPQRWLLLLSVASAVLGMACGLAPFYAAYRMVLAVGDGSLTLPDTLFWTFVIVGAVVAKAALMMASTYLSHVAAFGLLHEFRRRLIARFNDLPLGFFSAHPAGTLKKTVAEDVEQIEEAIAHAIPDLSAGVAVPLLTAAFLAIIDWRLALAAIALFPLLLALYPLTLRLTKPHSAAHFLALTRLKSVTIEYVQGMKVIRAFLRSEAHYTELKEAIDTVASVGERYSTAALVPMSLIYAGLRGNILVLLPVGGALLLAGSIDAATFALFLMMGMGINASAMKLLFAGGTFYWRIKMAAASIETILGADPLPVSDDPKTPAGAAVRFEGVDFAYADRPVLRAVDFTAEEGRFTAIVGPSGSGKTTIARLIARFWDVNGGRVTLGGVDVRDIAPDDLMGRLALVLQDAWLLNDTVRANIRAGRPDATPEEIEDAARRARVLDFVDDLPQGLDTPVGEGGRQLSGGQRQRVAIARAILKAAPVVILDEATAALDPENEALILEALQELARDRTVIAIAHRLETIRAADRILYLEAGQVRAQGDHDTLMDDCPEYAQLWRQYEAVASWQLPTEEGQALAARPDAAVPPLEPSASVAPETPDAEAPAGPSLSRLTPLALFLALAGPMKRTLMRRALPLLFVESMFMGTPVFVTFVALHDAFAGVLSPGRLALYTGVVLACLAIQAVVNVKANRTLWCVQTGAVAALQRRIGAHLRRVPLGEILSRNTAVIEAAITQHATETNFVVPPSQVMRALVGPAVAFAILAAIDWRLTLALAGTLPLFALTVAWGDRRYRAVWQDLVVSLEAFGSRLLDYIQGMATIRSLGLGGDRFTALSEALERHRRVSIATVARLTPAVGTGWAVLDAAFALVVLVGGTLMVQGDMGPDRFLLFLVFGVAFLGPIGDAFDLVAYGRLLERSMRRVGAILDLPVLPEPTTPRLPASLDISFDHVSFSYGDRPALRDVSFTLEGGRVHALVGPSGSGKSTALSLIARLWDVDAGHIRIGGADLRDIPTPARERLVSIVFQDTVLFNDTITANLRLAKPDATDGELVAAAKAARCHDVIMALEHGYDTVVGEGGGTLSSGERQRIAIARAILKDAPILLLDEATASLDPDNEYEVRAALAEACRGKTVVIVAHRPNTIVSADRVVVFDSGRVVETVSGFTDPASLRAVLDRRTQR
ncbi:ABC transporter ATP-binding protein [Rhodospira trueperi]|uniref:ATP-binding cassette, subfamily B/ATP-binding cassette, subfamily C, CydCD n=1 Tax=Rhodospira trueperi TaxID=69960 RepID=A0A1G7EPI8_9PROT|nr:ABC transporter ATP-binding protein [Rhodospira trueperi]SDE65295.1 ATP-binding cassette, subfamily B/ATP-binding cassette, subfamily C, CydCD [Rhodospira trueperi]